MTTRTGTYSCHHIPDDFHDEHRTRLAWPTVSGGRVRPTYGNELDFADAMPGGSQSGYDRYIEAQGAAVRERTEAITQRWTSNPASDAAS